MARVKIELPENFVFETNIAVRIDDVNYGNHLGNDAIVGYLQEIRLRFLAKYNLSELDIGGASLIQADLAVSYKSEGFYGNQVKGEINVADFSKAGFDFVYRLNNETTGKLMAVAKTGMVCFNYEERKIREVPTTFISLIEKLNK